jgi:4'-phosphopantetheinyl transferase EntD
LLADLGFEPTPLLPAPDRTPQWPRGAIGSIAHSGELCAVAVARTGRLAAIGLDVEPDEPLEDDLWTTVCTDRELAWISACPEELRGRTARVLFSAKECAYKCIYPLTHTALEFQDVEIALARDAGVFWARLRDHAATRVPLTLKGFRLSCGGSIVTGMALPASRLTEAT